MPRALQVELVDLGAVEGLHGRGRRSARARPRCARSATSTRISGAGAALAAGASAAAAPRPVRRRGLRSAGSADERREQDPLLRARDPERGLDAGARDRDSRRSRAAGRRRPRRSRPAPRARGCRPRGPSTPRRNPCSSWARRRRSRPGRSSPRRADRWAAGPLRAARARRERDLEIRARVALAQQSDARRVDAREQRREGEIRDPQLPVEGERGDAELAFDARAIPCPNPARASPASGRPLRSPDRAAPPRARAEASGRRPARRCWSPRRGPSRRARSRASPAPGSARRGGRRLRLRRSRGRAPGRRHEQRHRRVCLRRRPRRARRPARPPTTRRRADSRDRLFSSPIPSFFHASAGRSSSGTLTTMSESARLPATSCAPARLEAVLERRVELAREIAPAEQPEIDLARPRPAGSRA